MDERESFIDATFAVAKEGGALRETWRKGENLSDCRLGAAAISQRRARRRVMLVAKCWRTLA